MSVAASGSLPNASVRPGPDGPVDVGHILDHGPWTGYQKIVLVMAALAVVLDGFDVQLIGFVIPSLIREWGISGSAFGPVVAAGMFGMAVGTSVIGVLADRLGRRRALIACVVVFGLATLGIAWVSNLTELMVLRFVAGVGIGAAMPVATTMGSEFTPLRVRALAVTLIIVCIPVGGIIAGFIAASLLPLQGWRGLFVIGGLAPLAFAAVLALLLPESPRFLVRREARWGELGRLLSRLGRPVAASATFADHHEQHEENHTRLQALFRGGRRRDTLCLWGAFFCILMVVYSVFSWLPTMLTAAGYGVAQASRALAFFNVGGVAGAVVCALVVGRLGSRWPLVIASLLSAAALVLVRTIGLGGAENIGLLLPVVVIAGVFVNAVQSLIYALATHVYTTNVRTTGVATAATIGRVGAILSAFYGAFVISGGGAPVFLAGLAGLMVATAVFLAGIRRHIPAHGRP